MKALRMKNHACTIVNNYIWRLKDRRMMHKHYYFILVFVIQSKRKISYPPVPRTSTISNFVLQNPRVLVQEIVKTNELATV